MCYGTVEQYSKPAKDGAEPDAARDFLGSLARLQLQVLVFTSVPSIHKSLHYECLNVRSIDHGSSWLIAFAWKLSITTCPVRSWHLSVYVWLLSLSITPASLHTRPALVDELETCLAKYGGSQS